MVLKRLRLWLSRRRGKRLTPQGFNRCPLSGVIRKAGYDMPRFEDLERTRQERRS